MDDDGRPRLFERLPGGVEHPIIGRECPDLDVDLEQLSSGGQGGGHVVGGFGLGVEGSAVDDVVVGGGELGVPVVQPCGHAGSVRVGERRDRADAELADDAQPRVSVEPIGDRPVPAVVLRGIVEVRPDLVEHVLREEVHVDVGQPRQTEGLQVGGDLRVRARGSGHRGGIVGVDHGPTL